VRCGSVPPLVDRYSVRQESAPELRIELGRSTAVALVSAQPGDGIADWPRSCGKTQLAAYYAEAQWRARAVELLLWIDGSSRAGILAGYAEAAEAVSGSRAATSAESVAASFLRWLSRTERRWLVVLDDLASADLLDGLWPAGRATGQVVITAASRSAVGGLSQLLVLEVGPFSRREAMSYLVARLSADPDQRRGAMDLIEDLRCEPAALAQSTAVVASSRITCEDYRARFARRVPQLSHAGREPRYASAVTWTLAVDRADQMLPGGSTHACLAFAALLDAHGMPEPIFSTAAASGYISGDRGSAEQVVEHAQAALTCLEHLGLVSIDRSAAPGTVRMSGPLAQAVRAATPQEMRDQAGLAAAAALLEIWPADAIRACAPLGVRSSAEALRRVTAGLLWSNGCHPLLLRAGQCLDVAMLTGPAVEYWAELASVSDRVFGPGHDDSMLLVERLIRAFAAAGRTAEALDWSRRAIAEWSRAYGGDQSRTLPARVNLGRVLVVAGLAREAITVLTSAVEDCDRVFGPDHPDSRDARDELAGAYLAAGQLEEAVRLYRITLGDRERSAGPLDPGTIVARRELAAAYMADGRTKEAISQFKRALSDSERSMGPDHPSTLRTRTALASAYHQAGRMAVAVQMYEEARDGSERSLGPDHADTLAAAVSLADAYYAVGRLSDASRLYEEALARSERVLGPGHQLTQAARNGQAAISGAES
jgi:tetratricopeptide (TPR) repeat protein